MQFGVFFRGVLLVSLVTSPSRGLVALIFDKILQVIEEMVEAWIRK
jgi:hypothetical protein